MKFGVCTAIENIEIVQQSGCDYLEAGFGVIASLTHQEFLQKKALIDAADIKVEAMNSFLPGSFSLLVEYEKQQEALLGFIDIGMNRAKQLGTQVVVFGSGVARRMPEGMSWETAFGRLARFLAEAQQIADRYGIKIAVEPLNKGECNIINSVREGDMLALASGAKNAGALADLYHMALENEDMSGIIKAGKRMLHCHIANPAGRRYPMAAEEYDYAGFFNALRSVDYDARISVEAGTDNIAVDLPKAVELMRSI